MLVSKLVLFKLWNLFSAGTDDISYLTFHSDPTTSYSSLHDRHMFRNKDEMNYGVMWQCTYHSLRLDKSLEIGARKIETGTSKSEPLSSKIRPQVDINTRL